jgi:hypothetical protein
MSMIACRECGRQISSTAAACPGCGAKPKAGFSLGKALLLGFGGMLVLGYLAGNSVRPDRPAASTVKARPAPPERITIDDVPPARAGDLELIWVKRSPHEEAIFAGYDWVTTGANRARELRAGHDGSLRCKESSEPEEDYSTCATPQIENPVKIGRLMGCAFAPDRTKKGAGWSIAWGHCYLEFADTDRPHSDLVAAAVGVEAWRQTLRSGVDPGVLADNRKALRAARKPWRP